jgi:hypothetical protein
MFAAFLLLWAAPAFSQGCSMCYSTAKATSKDGQRAISKGVVVLLLPPLGFMTLGVWAAFRYGKKRDLEQGPEAGIFSEFGANPSTEISCLVRGSQDFKALLEDNAVVRE